MEIRGIYSRAGCSPRADFDGRESKLDGPERDRAVDAPWPWRRQRAVDYEERIRRQQLAPATGTDGRRASKLFDRTVGDIADERR